MHTRQSTSLATCMSLLPILDMMLLAMTLITSVIHPASAAAAAAAEITSQRGHAKSNVSDVVLKEIMTKMDNKVRPGVNDDKPVDVRCGFHIMSFGSISELNMDYNMDIYLRQIWTDPRLQYTADLDHVVLNARVIEDMWIPDLFFPNEKAAYFHDITVPNRLMRVYPNGTVVFSVRITLTLSCPMDLSHFPLDHQRCHISLESYAHETTDMTLTWFDDDPVGIDTEVELPQFDLLSWSTVSCERLYKTGSFPCLKARFSMRRQYGFFMLQTYVPSMLIVVLSWVSFWINMDAVPARISLGVTTVLTMATALSGSKASIPKVSYPKAIDVWMATCMIFVFMALLEYAFVNAMCRKPTEKKTGEDEEEEEEEEENEEQHKTKRTPFASCRTKTYSTFKHYFGSRESARRLDKGSRVLFPVSFLVFNTIYWAYYTHP